MKLRPPLPGGMTGRIALVLLGALAVELGGNALLYSWQEHQLVSSEKVGRIADRIVGAEQVALRARTTDRADFMAGLGTKDMTLNWVSDTVLTDSSAAHRRLGQFKRRLQEGAPELGERDLRLSLVVSDHGRNRDLIGALRLNDGSFLTFRVRPFLNSPASFALIVALHVLLMAVVMGAALLLVRALLRPLSNLAQAANATGRGSFPTVAIEGPREVRQVAVAFADMQSRLLRIMDEHTQALVAVSHDLRTPIQRLRLRASFAQDKDLRDAMAADLIDMEVFIASTLAYMRGEEAEESRLIDLAAIAMTMVDNAADGGAEILYQGPDSLPLRLKPSALKRALGNLIENAVRHADHVRVGISDTASAITIMVEDDGPGIAPERREEAFLPFRRLEASGRPTGGAGLGLAIAEASVAALGAKIRLDQSPLGGLAAIVSIPPRR